MATLSRAQKPDIVLEDEGTIVLVRPLTKDAKAWVADNVDLEVPRFCGAVPVPHSELERVTAAMVADGLTVAAGGEL